MGTSVNMLMSSPSSNQKQFETTKHYVQSEECFNPLNPSAYYIYHQITHYINSTFCPYSVFVWI